MDPQAQPSSPSVGRVVPRSQSSIPGVPVRRVAATPWRRSRKLARVMRAPRLSSQSHGQLPNRLRWIAAALALVVGLLVGLGSTAPAFAAVEPSREVVMNATGSRIAEPRLRVMSWVLVDLDSGEVLAGKDWRVQRAPASTLKTLTALALAPRLNWDSRYRATVDDAEQIGSEVGLHAGSTYSVRDLMHGLLMPSGNDAAMALANAYGGVDPVVELMNREAARVGAVDTVAKNPSGLDEPGQVSTPRDLVAIFRESLNDPALAEVYLLHDVQFPDKEPKNPQSVRKSYPIWVENRLILNYHPGALGGKNGFTSQAGRTFVGGMQRDGRRLGVALMGINESTEASSRRLLDWGFTHRDSLQAIDVLPGVSPADGNIERVDAINAGGGGGAGTVAGAATESGSVAVLPLVLSIVVVSGLLFGISRWRSGTHRT